MAAKEPEDIVENDPFDPKVLEQAEALVKEEEQLSSDSARAQINRRKEAYARVFTAGERGQADIDIVLNDLMWFCKVWVPTFDIKDGQHAETLSKMKDGRREVFQRIKEFSRLDSDALMLKYTDAIKPK